MGHHGRWVGQGGSETLKVNNTLLSSSEGQLARLQDLGFKKEDCRRALILCKGGHLCPQAAAGRQALAASYIKLQTKVPFPLY